MPRFPDIHVAVRSPHPLVLVSAVRHALRRAGVAREQIRAFSNRACTRRDPEGVRSVCREWVWVDGGC